MNLTRPEPPALPEGAFAPAPDLAEWARAAFLTEGEHFWTDEHAHLVEAKIVWIWTSSPGKRRGKQLAGECQLVQARGSQWAKLRDAWLLTEWWKRMPDYDQEDLESPDFAVTLYAPWCAAADDASFCALVDHELTHASQAIDGWGLPKVSAQMGRPVFELKPHDVEQFVSVVRRWGAAASGVEALVAAAKKPPEIALATIGFGCGTCRKAA